MEGDACCQGTITPIKIGTGEPDIIGTRENSFFKLSEGGLGDHLACIAYGNPSGNVVVNVTKGNANIKSCPPPEFDANSKMLICPFIAEETGTYTCELIQGGKVIKSYDIKVTESGASKDTTKLPFFGLAQFISALALIMGYLLIKKRRCAH